MATKRPAKLAIGKKVQAARLHPRTNKPMTAAKVCRAEGGTSMRWVVLEDFDGSETAVSDLLPIR